MRFPSLLAMATAAVLAFVATPSMAQDATPPPTTASNDMRIEIGFGTQASRPSRYMAGSDIPSSHASVRFDTGAVGFSGAFTVRPGPMALSSFGETLLQIARTGIADGLALNVVNDFFVLSGGVDTSFGRRDVDTAGLSGGPRLMAGVNIRLRHTALATHGGADGNGQSIINMEKTGTKVNIGPYLGVSVDGWWRGKWGLRLSFIDQIIIDRGGLFAGTTSKVQPSNNFAMNIEFVIAPRGLK